MAESSPWLLIHSMIGDNPKEPVEVSNMQVVYSHFVSYYVQQSRNNLLSEKSK